MSIPLMDLAAEIAAMRPEIDDAVASVLDSGQFILGEEVSGFEESMAGWLGVEHAVGLASGTDALVLALRALGIGPGDEVLCPAYTFFATVEAVIQVGARPVLVDVADDTLCIDAAAAAERVTDRTRAVIPVHLYGHPADMGGLARLAEERGLALVEDAAQALGAEWEGDRVGALGDVGCLSFFPSKNLGALGDAGMLVTDDAELADRTRLLRTHGWRRKYHPEVIGYNSRLDALQAAILRVKLARLDARNQRRRALARRYTELLAEENVRTPVERPDATHVYHLYVLRLEGRDAVLEALRAAGIGCGVYYPLPMHLVEACGDLGYRKGEFPAAERAAEENLAIPLYPEMTEAQQDRVVDVLRQALTSPANG